MKSCSVVLKCSRFLHLRPAAEVVDFASLFTDHDITLKTGSFAFDPRSIIALTCSGLGNGKSIELEVAGEDEVIVLILLKGLYHHIAN